MFSFHLFPDVCMMKTIRMQGFLDFSTHLLDIEYVDSVMHVLKMLLMLSISQKGCNI